MRHEHAALQYLLVGRHGSRRKPAAIDEVAHRLTDTLEELGYTDQPLQIATVIHAATPQTRCTAKALVRHLCERDCGPVAYRRAPEALQLSPSRFKAFAPHTAEPAIEIARDKLPWSAAPDAVVIIGHEPAISWVLEEIVDAQVTLASAEIACLVREPGRRCHLWWTIAPSEDLEAVRTKIASKMTVVGILTGFALAILGGILVQLPKNETASWIALGAVALYGVAVTLLVCTLMAYDQLTMPPRFWQGKRSNRAPVRSRGFPVARPPSSAVRIMIQHAVRLWTSVLAALLAAAAGTAVLAVAAYWPLDGYAEWGAIAATATLLAVLAIGWWLRFRPDLGSED